MSFTGWFCVVHMCVCLTRSNCFCLCLLTLMLNISKWVYWMVLCMCVFLTRSNLFLIWSAHSGSIANNQEVSLWSLFVCLTRNNPFLSLPALSIANISEWVLLNGLVLYMCVCLTRSNLFLSLSAYSNANISEWVLVKRSCVVYVWVTFLFLSLSAHFFANIRR